MDLAGRPRELSDPAARSAERVEPGFGASPGGPFAPGPMAQELRGLHVRSSRITTGSCGRKKKRDRAQERGAGGTRGSATAPVFESTPVAAIIVSAATGEILEVNQSFVNSTGLRPESAAGEDRQGARSLAGSSTRERGGAADCVASRASWRDSKPSFDSGGGGTAVALLSMRPVTLGSEACEVWQCVDITGRKSAENELQRHRRESRRDGGRTNPHAGAIPSRAARERTSRFGGHPRGWASHTRSTTRSVPSSALPNSLWCAKTIRTFV